MEVLDKVVVTRKACCFGFPKGTKCQIIKKYEDPDGHVSFLCYPIGTEGQQVAFWQCANCLEKIEVDDGTEGK